MSIESEISNIEGQPHESLPFFFGKLDKIKSINELPPIVEFNLRSGVPSSHYFKQTEQGRQLMTRGFDHAYSWYLFGVSDAGPVDEEIESIRPRVDNMDIMNIGGGYSLRDLLFLDEDSPNKLSPKSVVNVDPFIESEDIQMNKRGMYISISTSAGSQSLEEDLKNSSGPSVYDEIWAVYSCPFYLTSPVEIHEFFSNMRKILKQGSVLRVFPLGVCVARDGIYSKNIEERTNSIKKEIEIILESGEYETYIEQTSGGNLLLIRKV